MDKRAISKALVRYRVMAYVVGVFLVVLICVGMPLKYLSPDPTLNELGGSINTVIGIAHGWLYMLLLITAYDLGRRVRWTWKRLIMIALAGTIPFLSFVAERFATKNVREHLREVAPADTAPPAAADKAP